LANQPLPYSNEPSGGSQVFKDFQLDTSVKSKSDFAYGKKIAQYIESTVLGTTNYFWLRNNRFRLNRNLAYGRVDMTRYMDRLDMNGKVNYVNINWKAISIVNTIISRMVGRWMQQNEKIFVTAIDTDSQESKTSNYDEADFLLHNKEMLANLQGQSGVPMVNPNQFIPEDKDELDSWSTEFNRLPEEIGYEKGINNVFWENGFFTVIKEKLLHDSAEVGLVGTYKFMDENGKIHIEWVKPENMLYSYSEYPDFRDCTWMGRIVSLKVSELRAKYGQEFGGKFTEEEIWKIAQSAKEYQLYDKIRWLSEWNVSILRPYDEWNIDVIEFEVKSLDEDNYTIVRTIQNNSTIIKKGLPDKKEKNARVVKDKKWNIYRGVYTRVTQDVLEWGIKQNMIRPQGKDKQCDAEFSYSFYMYQNNDMKNLAIPEKREEPVEQMIMARLKIQQLVAKMKPIGAAINVDAAQEIDIGLAGGPTKAIEIERIWEQTGVLYYRGKDAEGNPIPVPITELANSGFTSQLQGLIELYNFHYQVLRDEAGLNEVAEGQSMKPRYSPKLAEQQAAISFNATDYMYDAYLHVMEETAKKVACLLNVSVSYGAKTYRHILKQDEVKNRDFSTKIQMLPDDDEILNLQQTVNTAIASNPELVVYLDPFKIMRIAKEDVKLAELYFRQAQKRYIKSKTEQTQQNSEQNIQGQIASAQSKAQGDMELQKAEAQAAERLAIVQGAFTLAQKGVGVPPQLMQVLTGVITNIAIPLMAENQQMQAQMQQQMQQAQQPPEGQPEQQQQEMQSQSQQAA
jgi:hypothetical protein